MNKSTLMLVAVATLILGALIGAGVVKQNQEPPPSVQSEPVTTAGEGLLMRYLEPDQVEVSYDEYGTVLPYSSGDNYVKGERAWRHETLSIEIKGDQSVEYKALMNQGESLNFQWTVEGGQAYYDMHAHDDAFGKEFFTRYDEGEGVSHAGTIIAPYSGEHGWFWLNLEEGPITITLEVAGFFEKIVEIDLEAEY